MYCTLYSVQYVICIKYCAVGLQDGCDPPGCGVSVPILLGIGGGDILAGIYSYVRVWEGVLSPCLASVRGGFPRYRRV